MTESYNSKMKELLWRIALGVIMYIIVADDPHKRSLESLLNLDLNIFEIL